MKANYNKADRKILFFEIRLIKIC